MSNNRTKFETKFELEQDVVRLERENKTLLAKLNDAQKDAKALLTAAGLDKLQKQYTERLAKADADAQALETLRADHVRTTQQLAIVQARLEAYENLIKLLQPRPPQVFPFARGPW